MAKRARDELAHRVRKLRTDLDLTQTQFGARVGADQSNVSKWERGEDKPSPQFAFRMSELAGLPSTWFLLPETKSEDAPYTKTVRLIGEVQADAWKEAIEWPSVDQLEIPFPPGLSTIMLLTAFRVVGSSFNKIYPDRSTIYVAPATARQLSSGQKLLVIRRNSEALLEATIKEYVVLQDGSKWLWPRSYDPQHQTPVRCQGKRKEGVTIAGVVVAATILEEVQ